MGIVLIQEGQRKIQVRFPNRTQGAKVYGGQSTFIPLRVNSAGMIPLIFASSIIIFPATVAAFFVRRDKPDDIISNIANWFVFNLGMNSGLYQLLYFAMVVGFTYLYTWSSLTSKILRATCETGVVLFLVVGLVVLPMTTFIG